jgi:hypothetical protein
MGKNPAFQFYPSDWTRDMGPYSLEICGAWINILCSLFWDGGKQTKSIDEWARILRENRKKTEKILDFLEKKSVADFERLDNQSLTIISRRMVRDFRIAQLRKEVGRLGGNPNLIKSAKPLLNQTVNQKPTPSSSTSSSTSKKKRKTFTIPSFEEVKAYCLERKNVINPQTFIDHYTGNGWKVGINPMKDWKAVIRTWETRGGNGNGIRDHQRTREAYPNARRGQPEPGGLGLPGEYIPEDIPDITEAERQRNLARLAELTR